MDRAPRLHAAWIAAVAVAPVLSACGDEAEYRNEERPPTPITVTAYVDRGGVSISPSRIGGGPVTIIATNQTGRSQQLVLETADDPGGDEVGIRQRTGPVNPGDTASIRADVREGTYRVGVRGDAVESATLEVGERRETSQQDLLLP